MRLVRLGQSPIVAECHCANRPSFFAGKKVSRRPSRPPNTPRGRHRAGRGHAECRRPRKRCLTCLLIDPRGRFRQLAARPRAIQTGSIDILTVKRPKPPSSRSRTTGMCAQPFVPGESDKLPIGKVTVEEECDCLRNHQGDFFVLARR